MGGPRALLPRGVGGRSGQRESECDRRGCGSGRCERECGRIGRKGGRRACEGECRGRKSGWRESECDRRGRKGGWRASECERRGRKGGWCKSIGDHKGCSRVRQRALGALHQTARRLNLSSWRRCRILFVRGAECSATQGRKARLSPDALMSMADALDAHRQRRASEHWFAAMLAVTSSTEISSSRRVTGVASEVIQASGLSREGRTWRC